MTYETLGISLTLRVILYIWILYYYNLAIAIYSGKNSYGKDRSDFKDEFWLYSKDWLQTHEFTHTGE